MSWQAIPDTRPRDSETSVIECVVCAWNNTRSVGRRAQVTSRPFRDQMYVVRQVRRYVLQMKWNEIYLRQISRIEHKEQSEYVDRTQRQHETALLTRALKIKTTLQHKFQFGNFVLKTGCSRRSNNMTRKRIPRITCLPTYWTLICTFAKCWSNFKTSFHAVTQQ